MKTTRRLRRLPYAVSRYSACLTGGAGLEGPTANLTASNRASPPS